MSTSCTITIKHLANTEHIEAITNRDEKENEYRNVGCNIYVFI